MKEEKKTVIITNKLGVHLRSASKFTITAQKFKSKIMIIRDDNPQITANGKSILSILSLGACRGDKLIINAKGEDADKAISTLSKLVDDKFEEEK